MAPFTLTSVSVQQQVNYLHFAQQRVAADTLRLTKEATLALSAGVGTYDVPDDLIELYGIFGDNVELDPIPTDRLMAALSGVGPGNYNREQGYAIVGRTFYILPTPTEAQTLTLIYAYRPSTFGSGSEISLDSEALHLLEDLVDAQITFDRGEVEVGAAGLEDYYQRVADLRKRLRSSAVGRMRVMGPDIVS